MPQYLITAYDGTDTEAASRRLAARSAHLDGMRKMREQGRFLEGGAILNDEGQMIGSAMIVEFALEDDLQAWLKSDAYITGEVWKTVDVRPFRCAPK